MTIKKINNEKIKIIFYSTELMENNISVHSFLSGSIESHRFIYKLLDIANENLCLDLNKSSLIIEIFSFNNSKFVLFCSNKPKEKYIILKEPIICLFKNFNDIVNFSIYITTFFFFFFIKSSLYKYNNNYYLTINSIETDCLINNKIISTISEFTNSFTISNLCFSKFKEFSELLIKSNAIEMLNH